MVPAPADLYLELVKRSLLGELRGDAYELHPGYFGPDRRIARVNRVTERAVQAVGQLSGQRLGIVRRRPEGTPAPIGSWPLAGETMIGRARLDHLQACVEDVLDRGVPGDLIETGVWRGGATILMRAVLAARGDADRVVYAADSFAGLPAPRADGPPADAGHRLHTFEGLAVGLEEVRAAFARYGLLDDQVRFLPGLFRDTLPGLGGRAWSVVRLDGDLHESTTDALEHLYAGLQPGGYLIVDDLAIASCRQAVDEFRERHGITEPLERIDASAGFWRRAG